MSTVMAAHARNEFVIVLGEGQGLVHLQVREPPVAVGVVQVLLAVLKKHADGFLGLGLADERRVNVAAADVREAADNSAVIKAGAVLGSDRRWHWLRQK